MLVNDSEAAKRLNSPMNLMNRLKNESSVRKSAMSLFIPSKKQEELHKSEEKIVPYVNKDFNPFLPEQIKHEESVKLSDILENGDAQINLGLAHDSALKLLNKSLTLLETKIDDIKADKLPSVISAASKTVESIRKERAESSKNNKDREVHYHFYTPEQKTINDYKIIDVTT